MKKVIAIFAGIASLALGACTEIGPGERGVFVEQGKATEAVGPGWHGYNPLTTDVAKLSVRQLKWDGETVAYTKDVQQAEVDFTLTYSLNPKNALATYRDVGEEWANTLVPQVVYQSIKDEFGQAEAVKDAINDRARVQGEIRSRLTPALASRGIVVHGFELTDISFSSSFEAAVEKKQVAVELANAAKNETVRVEEEARQRVIAAKADAEAMEVKNRALAGSPKLVEYEAVKRWNGKLCPDNSTCVYGEGAVPFINVK